LTKDFLEIVKQKTIIFDGAMGTMLMEAGQASAKSPVLLNVEQPALVTGIHKRYYDAGSDVVIANTFGGNPLKLAADGLEQQMEQLNRQGVMLARRACPDGKFVAGDIGPCGKMLAPLGDISAEDMQKNFFMQAGILIDSGADLITIETMYSLEEALLAVNGVRRAGDIPLLASMTFTQTKNGFFTIMGDSLEKCIKIQEECQVDVIGSNCTLGSLDMIDLLKEMKKHTQFPISIKPNAGKPRVGSNGQTYYDQPISEFVEHIHKMIDLGAKIVGGCCGTSPETIKGIKKVIHSR